MADFKKVTRVEVIDGSGTRAFTAYYDAPGVIPVLQDEGRTLKIFVDGWPAKNVPLGQRVTGDYPRPESD